MRLLARGLSAAALLLVPLAVMPPAPASASTPSSPTPAAPAPLIRSDQAVPDEYIVTLQKSVAPASVLDTLGVTPMFTYGSALRGFAAVLSAPQLAAVRMTPGVTAVEENGAASAYDLDDSGRSTHAGPQSRATAASWGLDRIDQRDLPLDRQFTTVGNGQGATAYIMDSGIDYGHSEFGGRAVPGFDAVGDGKNGQDCQGHGTHVAGTVGGATYGVAPKAKLVSVRVLGCDGKGTWAGIIAGFDWIAKNAVQPAVMNASLGGSYSPAVNDAANAVAEAGVLPVIAAGNSTVDACDISPASASEALTVGASDRTDQQTGFSNYGTCLSVFAPGKDIVSAKLGGGSVALDGTSMASPHAAGVALLYKAAHPSASAADVADWLDGQATEGVLTVNHNSPDRLLYTGGM